MKLVVLGLLAVTTMLISQGASPNASQIADCVLPTANASLLNHDIQFMFGSADRKTDTDKDGLSDWKELQVGTNPAQRDTDSDGIDDAWEVQFGLNPLSTSDTALDLDGDGVSNLEEYQAGTEPNNATSNPEQKKLATLMPIINLLLSDSGS